MPGIDADNPQNTFAPNELALITALFD